MSDLRARLLLLILVAGALISCGGNGTSSIKVSDVTVDVSTNYVHGGGAVVLWAAVTTLSDTQVTWTATGGTLSPNGDGTETWTAPPYDSDANNDYTVTATSQGLGTVASAQSATQWIHVDPGIAVTLTTTAEGTATQCTATVTGGVTNAFEWLVFMGNDVVDKQIGGSYLFTPPINSSGPFVVMAISREDPTRYTKTVVSVKANAGQKTISVTPANASVVEAGHGVSVGTAVALQCSQQAVTWEIVSGGGTLSSKTGGRTVYSAPSGVPSNRLVEVRAKTTGSPSVSCSTFLTITLTPFDQFTMPLYASVGQIPATVSQSLMETGSARQITVESSGSLLQVSLPAGVSITAGEQVAVISTSLFRGLATATQSGANHAGDAVVWTSDPGDGTPVPWKAHDTGVYLESNGNQSGAFILPDGTYTLDILGPLIVAQDAKTLMIANYLRFQFVVDGGIASLPALCEGRMPSDGDYAKSLDKFVEVDLPTQFAPPNGHVTVSYDVNGATATASGTYGTIGDAIGVQTPLPFQIPPNGLLWAKVQCAVPSTY